MRWMDEDGLDFVNSIPKPEVGPSLEKGEQLFAPRDLERPWGGS